MMSNIIINLFISSLAQIHSLTVADTFTAYQSYLFDGTYCFGLKKRGEAVAMANMHAMKRTCKEGHSIVNSKLSFTLCARTTTTITGSHMHPRMYLALVILGQRVWHLLQSLIRPLSLISL